MFKKYKIVDTTYEMEGYDWHINFMARSVESAMEIAKQHAKDLKSSRPLLLCQRGDNGKYYIVMRRFFTTGEWVVYPGFKAKD